MSSQALISILLSIVSFAGIIAVTQLIRITNIVKRMDTNLQVQINDHGHLKKEVTEIKEELKTQTEKTTVLSARLLTLEYFKNGKHQ